MKVIRSPTVLRPQRNLVCQNSRRFISLNMRVVSPVSSGFFGRVASSVASYVRVGWFCAFFDFAAFLRASASSFFGLINDSSRFVCSFSTIYLRRGIEIQPTRSASLIGCRPVRFAIARLRRGSLGR